MTSPDLLRCSDVEAEPLAGSAKQESRYLLLEHPGGWSRDILDGDTFGEKLTAQLKAFLKAQGAGLQLIRRPGRQSPGAQARLYVVHAELGTAYETLVDGPADLLDLDLSAPGRRVEHPLVLVCTHGKRDVCCALKGRPLAATLADAAPEQPIVWETSHTKGHRFAPSILLMPWGYSYGRLNDQAALELLDAARTGSYFWPGNRGRGLSGPRGQVAELEVARQLLEAGEQLRFGELSAAEDVVTHRDGRQWRVALREQEVTGVVDSCGKAPKTSRVWVAEGVTLKTPGS